MLQVLELLARLLVALGGAPAGSVTGAPGLWELALAAAVGLAGGAVVAACARTAFVLASLVRELAPAEPALVVADVSRAGSQSDPDADGKPRPRAPGGRTAAAL